MYPQPFIITIGSLTLFQIMPYTLFFWLALISVLAGTYWIAIYRFQLPSTAVAHVLQPIAAGALIGARLWNVGLNWPMYQRNPELIIAWDAHGFSLYGGILGALLAGWIWCRRTRISYWILADAAAPAVGLGIALMRMGCFLHGCCFGTITSQTWGVSFPLMSPAHLYQLAQGQATILHTNPVHPTQLYELTAALIGSWIAWRIIKNKMPAGSAMGGFLFVFTACRLVIYYFRVMPSSYIIADWFYPLLYAGMLLAIGWVMHRQSR